MATVADIIRGNGPLQEGFGNLEVTSVTAPPPLINGNDKPQPAVKDPVIDGLLDLALIATSSPAFDARLAACDCIKAFYHNHQAIRKHFLSRAIEGHKSGQDETANILTILLRPAENVSSDPYKIWFAAVMVFHLVFDDSETKALAMGLVEGDASKGEEEVTCIQTIAANLVECLQKGEDDRISIGYLMLLCGWLFEDPDAVNDFLGEGSNVQSLVHTVLRGNREIGIVPGLCAYLIGIVYEFSTKDSPVPRKTLHPILISKLGREQYIDRLTKLRKESLLRDFEVLPQKYIPSALGGLPEVFFDKTFVDFVKDNFSRVLRAIDRDPGMEIPVIANGVQKGISRELVDTLRSQLEDKDKALQKAQTDLVSLDRQLGQEKADHRKTTEVAALDVNRIKSVNEGLQRHHDEDIK